MAVTVVTYKINRSGDWTAATPSGGNTDAVLVEPGAEVLWSVGTGLVGTVQLQVAVPGTNVWVPTPFNGSIDIPVTAVGVAGAFIAPTATLFRIALTAFTSGSATISIRK